MKSKSFMTVVNVVASICTTIGMVEMVGMVRKFMVAKVGESLRPAFDPTDCVGHHSHRDGAVASTFIKKPELELRGSRSMYVGDFMSMQVLLAGSGIRRDGGEVTILKRLDIEEIDVFTTYPATTNVHVVKWSFLGETRPFLESSPLALLPECQQNLQALQILLALEPSSVNGTAETKETPLFSAVKGNHYECVWSYFNTERVVKLPPEPSKEPVRNLLARAGLRLTPHELITLERGCQKPSAKYQNLQTFLKEVIVESNK